MLKTGRTGRAALIAAALATALGGCSTKPRNFAASVSTPVPDRIAFEQDYRTCDSLVKAGHKSNFKGAAATLAATGVGTVGASAAMMSTGLGGVNVMTGAASTSLAAVPVIGILAGFGVSRAIRGGKERKFKRNMSACLSEYGYEVADWEKLKKREDAAAFASRGVTVAEPVRNNPVLIEAVVVVEDTVEPVETTPEIVALVTPEG